MEEILEELNQTPGVQGSVIVDRDGLVIISAGNVDPDPATVGASTAEIFNSIESGAKDRGTMNMVSLEGSLGSLFLSNINDVTYLIVQTQEQINLGRIRYDIRFATGRLREEL